MFKKGGQDKRHTLSHTIVTELGTSDIKDKVVFCYVDSYVCTKAKVFHVDKICFVLL